MITDRCIAQLNGYCLYADRNGKPYVVRKWSTKTRDANGFQIRARHEARMDLTADSFPSGPDAAEAYLFLAQTWRDYTGWNEDNGKA